MNANRRESHETEDTLVETVVAAAYEVSNVLGAGFLEKIYQRAMLRELTIRGVRVQPEASLPVRYKGQLVGEYSPDLLVEDRLIVELKCADRFAPEHIAQCLNYLRASGLKIALLVNFQRPRVEWQRVVLGL